MKVKWYLENFSWFFTLIFGILPFNSHIYIYVQHSTGLECIVNCWAGHGTYSDSDLESRSLAKNGVLVMQY